MMLFNIAAVVSMLVGISLVISRIGRLYSDYSYINQDVSRFIDRN